MTTVQQTLEQSHVDHQQIVSVLPELVKGMTAQRDLLAQVEKSLERTNTIQEHMLMELKTLKEDRVTEDKRLAEQVHQQERKVHDRLTTIEAEQGNMRRAPWSLLVSGVGIMVTVAGMSAALVWFAISSQIDRVTETANTRYGAQQQNFTRLSDRVGDHLSTAVTPAEVIALQQRMEREFHLNDQRLEERGKRYEMQQERSDDDLRRVERDINDRINRLEEDIGLKVRLNAAQ